VTNIIKGTKAVITIGGMEGVMNEGPLRVMDIEAVMRRVVYHDPPRRSGCITNGQDCARCPLYLKHIFPKTALRNR